MSVPRAWSPHQTAGPATCKGVLSVWTAPIFSNPPRRMSRHLYVVYVLLLVAVCVSAAHAQGSSQKAVPTQSGAATKTSTSAAKPSTTNSHDTLKEGTSDVTPGAAYQVLVFSNTRPAAPAKIGAAIDQMKQALADYLFWAQSADQVSLVSVDFSKPKAKAVFEVTGPVARGGALDTLTNCQDKYILLFDKTLSANVAKELHKAIEMLWPGQSVTVSKGDTSQCTATYE